MKYLILTLLIGSSAHAFTSENGELICSTIDTYGMHEKAVAISCVSKASIEKDKAQLKLIKLQIKKLELEMKNTENK